MTETRQLGIWMDHANARFMEFHTGRMDTIIITSPPMSEESPEDTGGQQAAYYGKIAAAIKPFGEVVLFGPTKAKEELYNSIKVQPDFSHIRFEIKQAGALTEYQQYTFVREHFARL